MIIVLLTLKDLHQAMLPVPDQFNEAQFIIIACCQK
jgi:hypothetical protein